ncbi:hypothetical protein HPC49_19365 [Pyxidicoccus fallax]|uniref:Uncharacterized protein n=1 Tax=Pyxidicoccus fallax TaxID=394095 RepID=A0A848LF77_9BACT|nr:hypothetical protein [Pyxidicoccus fallax]NMO14188.1 hypothetical protein [Pyxidicoccus fallax]NPC80372.1 hypothetical protein [Pyxidicoccus fallax]
MSARRLPFNNCRCHQITNTLLAWTTSAAPGVNKDVLAVRVDAGGNVLEDTPITVETVDDRFHIQVTATFDGTDFWLAWEQTTATEGYPELEFQSDVSGARVRTDGTVKDTGVRVFSAPERDPVLISNGNGRVTVFYPAFVTEPDVMNLRIQGRAISGPGAASTEVGAPPPAAAR